MTPSDRPPPTRGPNGENSHQWPDARDRLAGISSRSLVLAGGRDPGELEKIRELAEGLPDARLVVFEESGHYLSLEQPEAFVTAVLEFLSES